MRFKEFIKAQRRLSVLPKREVLIAAKKLGVELTLTAQEADSGMVEFSQFVVLPPTDEKGVVKGAVELRVFCLLHQQITQESLGIEPRFVDLPEPIVQLPIPGWMAETTGDMYSRWVFVSEACSEAESFRIQVEEFLATAANE
jgi:hypothetical protein